MTIQASSSLGEASKETILLLSYCQGEPDYNTGVLVRKELNREKLEKDLMKVLILVKKLEFQVQDLMSRK